MLKFVFWTLLALNAALFAYGRGYLGKPQGSEREPARLKNQLAAGRLVLLSAAEARAAAASAAPVSETAAAASETAAAAPELLACVQAGPFAAGEARRFETRAAALALGERQSRIELPFQDVTSYMVYLPPNGGKEGADRRSAELKAQGVDNLFLIQGEGPMKHAISLGVFKTEAAAQTQVNMLGRQGVRGVRILPRGPQGTRTAYQFRNIDAALRERLEEIAGGQLRACAPAAPAR